MIGDIKGLIAFRALSEDRGRCELCTCKLHDTLAVSRAASQITSLASWRQVVARHRCLGHDSERCINNQGEEKKVKTGLAASARHSLMTMPIETFLKLAQGIMQHSEVNEKEHHRGHASHSAIQAPEHHRRN
ncbi:hypothetical protein CDAR_506561 [Caerostris darwini]|uniref:Uncharacterized protein n=1 Tax=Caerostris darwini TaxID=1538125 RepID=A0AAV4Q8Z0_9ARAC|nr:hypothetical protein CDAR_506561 [Caerostris darwini]